jgi:hypothetical protein
LTQRRFSCIFQGNLNFNEEEITMKPIGMVVMFLLGLALVYVGMKVYGSFGAPSNFFAIVLKVGGLCVPLILGLALWYWAIILGQSWQFDVRLTEMLNDFNKCEPGSFTLFCSSRELAKEFIYFKKDSMAGPKHYDNIAKRFTGTKI